MLPIINKTKTALRNLMLKTGQTTCYHVGDDGDYERGWVHRYTVKTTGAQSGTTNVDVACYAANTISFSNADSKIKDSASGLVTVLTGDTIIVKGSASNDGVAFTVTSGGAAGEATVNPAPTDELAGAYITLYKRASISNNTVLDGATGLEWLRNTTTGLKIGSASTGTLEWYNAASCFTLHPAGGDLQMVMPGNTLRIVGGAGEIARYHVGDILDLSGFANAANNLPGYRVLSVTVNGADLDIVLAPVNNTLIAEAAAGARAIAVVCRSIFTYCAAANAASLGGYTDWRIPNDLSLDGLRDMEQPTAIPDAVAFPGWPTTRWWSTTTDPTAATSAIYLLPSVGNTGAAGKTAAYVVSLVRGGG